MKPEGLYSAVAVVAMGRALCSARENTEGIGLLILLRYWNRVCRTPTRLDALVAR